MGGSHGGEEYSGGNAHFGGGYFGGDESADPAKGLREYEYSLSAKAKEEVIRRLARALKRAGINVDPEGDLDEIVRELVKQIPNPKKGKTFSNDAGSQEKICRVIADVLNDEFTPGITKASEKFIDTSIGPVEMCHQVGEWAHSFAAGVNTEFLAVHASVKNTLRSVEILAEIMKEIYGKIRVRVESADDPALGREFDPLNEIYVRAQNERLRQEELLKNILNVQLAPAAKELEIAMRDESEQNALIRRLGLKPGTSEFADSLAMSISGLGTAASIAHRVHKALKQVGINVREYLESEEFSDFQRLLDEKLESGSVKANDLGKFLEAVNTLHASFSHKDDRRFREAFSEESATGGRRRHGGADENDTKSSVQKRVERHETEKKLILRDFASRMSRHYDELLAAVKAMGPKLGREIPLSDKTDALNDALKRLREMRMVSQRIELALIGLFMEADSRENKEQFVSTLRVVSGACSAIMELEMYRESSSHFARLKAAIDGIEKTIDYFADVVTKKYGGKPHSDDNVSGGGVEDYLPEIARSGLSFGDAVSEFAYNYYVAKVRSNLDQTSAELDSYGEKYIELLGDAVASRIYTLGTERKVITDALVPLAPTAPPPPGGTGGQPPFDNDNAGKARYAAAQKWVNDEYDTKIKFYKALQAVDLYMKVFTAAIVKDPDSVRDIKQMLDGTQVIARWFSEQTGDNIWRAFECMGSINFDLDPVTGLPGAGAAKINSIGRAIPENLPAGTHYYNQLDGTTIQIGRKSSFGIPVCSVPCGADTTVPNTVDYAAKAKKAASDAIDYFQALKNLINAFARIGDKFGGREIRTQVFMSPTQIFKALTDYMKQSAMSINSGPRNGVPVAMNLAADQLGTPVDVIPQTLNVIEPWQVFFGSVGDLAGNYVIEDQYFTLIIKAMAAKVLTAVGVYDMFERATPLYDLTPTRMIIGGAEDFTNLEILEDAAELYFRLPRLAEFYRVFLRWDGMGNDLWRIAMLPELEGVFSGLIRFVFQKAVSPETGDYSDTEMYTLVREVNLIYEHFQEKQPGRATQAALSAFVMEVNRRYGVVKQKDMQDYMAMVKLTRTGRNIDVNDTNYAILPGEGESEIDRRAPSDRYSVPGAIAAATPFANRVGLDHTGGPPIGQGRKLLLRDFRIKFEKQFDLITNKSLFGKTSYSLLIKQAEREIRRAKTRDEKFPIVARLIQGTNLVGTDVNKSVMFHETVVVGLNLLSSFESMLRNFSEIVDRMDPVTIENTIMDAFYMNSVAAGGRAVPAPTLVSLRDIMRAQVPSCVDPDTAPAGTIYDRYLIFDTQANLAMRGNVEIVAIPVDVYRFLVAEEAAFFGFGGGGLVGVAQVAALQPSKITEEDPATNPDVRAAVAAAAIAGADLAIPRYIRVLRLCARLLTDYGKSMRDYVENVFDLMSGTKGADTSQALIEVRMSMSSTTGIQLNFSKFRDTVEKLLSDVKYFFDIFRPFLTPSTIKRFEDRREIGSVFWIEENLIDTFFRGKDSDPTNNNTFEGLARRASKVYANLIRKTNVPLGVLITHARLIDVNPVVRLEAIPVVTTVPNEPTRYEFYGQTFSELVFYNAVDGESRQPGTALGPLAGRNPLGSLIIIGRPAGGGGIPPAANGGAALLRSVIYDTEEQGMTRSRSLLFAYNQLIARYLACFTDMAGGQRIYLNLINSFANGVASRSVTTPGGDAYPDLTTANHQFGLRGDPVPGAVLFQSLAWIIQRLIKDVNPTNQMPDHIVSTLTDVPMYMKEAMRVDLPAFIKYFDLLAQKGDFIKQLMQKTIIRLDRPSQLGISASVPVAGIAAANNVYIRTSAALGIGAPIDILMANNVFSLNAMRTLNLLDAGQTDVNMKTRIAGIIDSIAAGAFTLSSAAAETLKELGDTPLYLQTQEGSIEQYKMRYERLPLMPISLSLYALNDLDAVGVPAGSWNDLKLFPGHVLGTPGFKLMYGTRQLIMRSSPVTFEQVPGTKAMLDSYNGVSGSRDRIDETRYLSFIQKTVSALRYITEARNIKSAMSTVNTLFSVRSLIYATAAIPARNRRNGIVSFDLGPPLVEGNAVLAVGAPTPPLQVILNVVESSNQDEELSHIANRVDGTTNNTNSRDLERILNLIDMNVIPINYHALMRDIPLANLYNYEYTFEQMVASMYGEQTRLYTEVGANAISNATTRNSRQMFLRLLVDPYLPVPIELYGSETSDVGSTGFVHRIFRGDNNLGMGRPKFLSDQLFNKALFGSLYQARRDFDEAGPSVGIGASRGQAVSAGPVQNMYALLSNFVQSLNNDRTAYLSPGLADAGGLTGAPPPGAAELVYDWIYGLNNRSPNARGRILEMATKMRQLTAVLARVPQDLPQPPFSAASSAGHRAAHAAVTPLLAGIVNLFQGAAMAAHDHITLMTAIDGLNPAQPGSPAHRVGVLAAGGYPAAADRLFAVEFNVGTPNSVPELMAILVSQTPDFEVMVRREVQLARRAPGAPGTTILPPPAAWRQQSGNRASTITYLKEELPDINDDSAIVEVKLPAFENKQRLEAIGMTRFNTRFVRNIFFITNVVRVLRLKLNRELTQSRNVLVSSHMSVAAGVTEYGSDPFGPNEVNASNMVTGTSRFNDRDQY